MSRGSGRSTLIRRTRCSGSASTIFHTALSPCSPRNVSNASAENTKGWPRRPSSYSVTAAHDGCSRHSLMTASMISWSTPGMSPSSITIAPASPAASRPAMSDDAQPVPCASLRTVVARTVSSVAAVVASAAEHDDHAVEPRCLCVANDPAEHRRVAERQRLLRTPEPRRRASAEDHADEIVHEQVRTTFRQQIGVASVSPDRGADRRAAGPHRFGTEVPTTAKRRSRRWCQAPHEAVSACGSHATRRKR